MALATVGLAASLTGTFIGGMLTTFMGLGHSLWVFGLLQIFSNVGYILLADSGLNRTLMYNAMAFESLTQGMGLGPSRCCYYVSPEAVFGDAVRALFKFIRSTAPAGRPGEWLPGGCPGVEAVLLEYHCGGCAGMLLLHRFAPLGLRDPPSPWKSPWRCRPYPR